MPLKKKASTASLSPPHLARLKLLTKQFYRSLDSSPSDDPLDSACPQGHVLQRVVGVPSTYTTTDMLCDGAGCGRTSVGDKQRNVWHHCATCRYDLCSQCVKASPKLASTTAALAARDAASVRLAIKYGASIFAVLAETYGELRVAPYKEKWNEFKQTAARAAVPSSHAAASSAHASGGGGASSAAAVHVCASAPPKPAKNHRGPAPPGWNWTMTRVNGKTLWKLKRRKCAVKKPVIYLYHFVGPVTVSVAPSGGAVITSTVPPAAEGAGFGAQSATWSVIAAPDGTLTLMDKSVPLPFSSLFWESTLPANVLLDGAGPTRCVARANVSDYLFRLFHAAGLSTREYTEAVQFWAPLMEKHAFVVARLLTAEEWSALAPLTVTPAPEHTLRVFIVWRGVKEYDAARDTAPVEDVGAAALPPRSGRWVVEWGGAEI